MHHIHHRPWRRAPFTARFTAPLAAACVVGASGLALAACSGSSTASSTTAAHTTTSTGSSSGAGSVAASISALSSSVQSGQHATYKATYTTHSSGGSSTDITIEQKPPKSAFSTAGGSVINDGTHTYYCSKAAATTTCVSAGGTGSNPLASLTTIFSPQTVLNALQQARAQAAEHAAGYSVSFSDGTYGGQASKCAQFTGKVSAKYCVTDSGVLAYVQSAGGTFELSGLSASPPDSDFSVPSGATIVTVPGVPSS